MDLALNDLQRLTCHKIQSTNQLYLGLKSVTFLFLYLWKYLTIEKVEEFLSALLLTSVLT